MSEFMQTCNMDERTNEEKLLDNQHYKYRPLISEMISHCPTLGEIDCIGLIEMINNYYGRINKESELIEPEMIAGNPETRIADNKGD